MSSSCFDSHVLRRSFAALLLFCFISCESQAEKLVRIAGRPDWEASASHKSEEILFALDGDFQSRYSTKAAMEPGMWVQVKLPEPLEIRGVELSGEKSKNDYPRQWKVETSLDAENWKDVFTGEGTPSESVAHFEPTRAKYVRLTQQGKAGNHWSIHELFLLGKKGEVVELTNVEDEKTDVSYLIWKKKADKSFGLRPTAEEKKVIAANLPEATAVPKKKRRVLCIFRCNGFIHGSIPYGNEALRLMGEATGAYEMDIADTYDVFSEKNLENYDLVFFNNTTGLNPNEEQRRALYDFVEKEGKGIAGLHAATDNFQRWPEGIAMMGGQFGGHPWGAGDTWAFKLEDPSHALNRAFKGEGFWLRDEIYDYNPKTYVGRQHLRVLVSIDMAQKKNYDPFIKNEKLKEKYSKRDLSALDVPVSWCREIGKGRLFYTNFGHNVQTFHNRVVLQHLLDGIQYALGDLEADAVPSEGLSVKVIPAPDRPASNE